MKILFCISMLILTGCMPDANKKIFYADYVIDGDTFMVNDIKIRIWGIDAPEKDELYYQTATLTLESIIDSVALECNYIEQGKYRRDVMRCYADGKDIAALMVEQGMARDVDGYYQRDEIYAQKNKYGIWKK